MHIRNHSMAFTRRIAETAIFVLLAVSIGYPQANTPMSSEPVIRDAQLLHWRYWTLADGLDESYVYHAYQDDKEQLWLSHGETDHVTLLDGYGVHSIPSPGYWLKVFHDPAGSLWAVNQQKPENTDTKAYYVYNGFQRFDEQERKWIQYPVDGLLWNEHPKKISYRFQPVSNRRILFIDRNQLKEYRIETQTITTILDETQTNCGSFRHLIRGVGDYVWLSSTQGVIKIDITANGNENLYDWNVYRFGDELELYEADPWTKYPFLEYTECNLYGMVQSATDETHRYVQLDGEEWKTIQTLPDEVFLAFPGAKGRTWMSYAPTSDFTLARQGHERTETIKKNNVLASQLFGVHTEPNGAFWVFTSHGLARYAPPTWETPEAVSGLKNIVHDILEDSQGRVWFNCHDTLAYIENGQWTIVPYPAGTYSFDRFSQTMGTLSGGRIALYIDQPPNLLIYDPHSGQFTPVQHPQGKFVHYMAPASGHSVFLITGDENKQNLTIEEFDGTNFTPITGTIADLSQNKAIIQNSNGDLWIGLGIGIGLYRNGEYRFLDKDDGFAADASFCLFDAGGGKVWAGDRKGLVEYDGTASTVLHQDMDRVSSIALGAKNDIWVATLTGLYRYYNGAWISNTEEDGLVNTAVYKVFIDSQHRVWAGTSEGISLYQPESDQDPPETLFDSQKNIAEIGPRGNAQFSFRGIDKWKYTDANRLLYSYRINDGEWSPFQADTVVSVTGLQTGWHRFDVRTVDRNWNIDLTPAHFVFRVMAPWYFQPMFLVSAILGVVVTLISLYFAMKHHRQLRVSMIKAESATQAKSQFLAKMSHEIRTPLNGIIGNLELLSFTKTNRKQNDLLRSVQVSAQTLLKIIGDVLDFAKIEADKLEFEYVETSPRDLIEETVSMLGFRARQKQIEMLADIDPHLPQTVLCDPVRVRQVLMNLVGNAIKFTHSGGVYISVYCKSIDRNVADLQFEISDTGEGFSAAPDDLFEEFVQFDTHAKMEEGTGLGLAIAKRIIDLMGGTIGCEGHKGYGARFWFSLALAVQQHADTASWNRSISNDMAILFHEKNDLYLWLTGILAKQEIRWQEFAVNDPAGLQAISWSEPFDSVFVIDEQGEFDPIGYLKSESRIHANLVLVTEANDPLFPFIARRRGYHYVLQYPNDENKIFRILYSKQHLTLIREQDLVRNEYVQKAIDCFKRLPLPGPILVVDDTETNRLLAANQLKEIGIECDLAKNGRQALDLAKSNRYALILVDCSMPVMDGYEFTQNYREWETPQGIHTPIVAMTARVVHGDKDRCLEAGMDDYLPKPVKIDRLAEKLLAWLGNSPPESEDIQSDISNPPEERSAMNMEPQPVDMDSLRNEIGIQDEEIQRQLLQAFVEDVQLALERFEQALSSQNREEMKNAAHAAKSAANSSAAYPLANVMKDLEDQSIQHDFTQLEDDYRNTQSVFLKTKNWVIDYLRTG